MKTKITLLMVFPILFSFFSYSQETEEKKFPAQLSFIYPVTTQGKNTVNYCYNFSLNALIGYTGSIKGCEIGGLVNVNKGDMSGFQAGGIGNVTGGDVNGMQTGGIFSYSDNMNGLQVNGIASLNADGLKGVQVSGIAGINSGDLNGVQVAGIFNYTRELKGLQLGLINVCDTNRNSLAIGLVSVAKEGLYQELSVSAADYLNIGVSYKAGVRHFYNIYTVGINFIDEPLWVAGLGFGHISEISPKYSFQPEIVCYAYFPVDLYQVRDTYITHIKFGFVREISPMFALSLAPSIYGALKSDRGIYESYGYDVSPVKPFYEFTGKNSNSKFELGAGLSLALNIR